MPITDLRRPGLLPCALLLCAGAADAAPTPQQLLPLEPSERVFRIAGGDGQEEAPLVMAPLEEEADGWRLSLEGYNDVYLKRTEAGIAITQVRIEEENKRIVFDEPVPLLPDELVPGEERQVHTQVRVYDLASGEHTHTGEVQHRLTARGPERFELPAGHMEGYRVELRQTMKFDLATLQVRLDTGYVPDQGIVQRRLNYEVKVLGLPFAESSRTAELAQAAAPAPTPVAVLSPLP